MKLTRLTVKYFFILPCLPRFCLSQSLCVHNYNIEIFFTALETYIILYTCDTACGRANFCKSLNRKRARRFDFCHAALYNIKDNFTKFCEAD